VIGTAAALAADLVPGTTIIPGGEVDVASAQRQRRRDRAEFRAELARRLAICAASR